MRRVLVVEEYNSEMEKLAEKLGCPEIASNVPRFEGYIQVLPSVVVESATNPGMILGVFNARKVSKEEIDTLEDLPEPEAVNALELKLEELETRIARLEEGSMLAS